MMRSKKGQGSFISGDIPSIIMIVISIVFFLSSIFMSLSEFESKKSSINMEAALVDVASSFLKENAKIRSDALESSSEFWRLKINKIRQQYAVEVYMELESVDPDYSFYDNMGQAPGGSSHALSKRFPIALRESSGTDLEIYPALIRVTVYAEQ